MIIKEIATIGAGCFWHIEEFYSCKKGVLSTRVGYMGGNTPNPTYKSVCEGKTGHAEVTEITFNSKIISYKKIIDFFWKIHDPCSLNRQGPDIGTQYRSVIFCYNKKQEKECLRQKKLLEENKIVSDKIVSEIAKATKFYEAEEYHQKYFKKNPTSVNIYCKTPELD